MTTHAQRSESITHSRNADMKELISLYERHANASKMNAMDHVEFEVRFGSSNIPITKKNFEDTYKNLMENGFKKDFDEYLLRLGFEGVENVRCEIESLSDIQSYCGSSNINDVGHRFVSKEKLDGVDNLYFNNDMNFRVSIKNERIMNDNDPQLSMILSGIENYTSNIRYIQRTSLFNDEMNNIRVDLSMVQKNKKRTTVFQDLVSDKYKEYYYEIEIEFVNIDKKFTDYDSLLIQMKKTIKMIMSAIQETKYPVSYSMQEAVLKNYLGLIGEESVDLTDRRTKITRYFIGPSSMTLQMENVVVDQNSSSINIQEDFCVTDKADGERKLLFINEDNRIYFINTNLQIQYTGTKMNKGLDFKNTLLDGEHIIHDKNGKFINLFAVFDVYFLRGKDMRSLPFMKHKSSGKKSEDSTVTRYRILKSLLNDKKSIMQFFKYESSKTYYQMKIHLKSFYEGLKNVPSKTIFDACKYILENDELGKFVYNIDGLIISSSTLGVGMTPEDNEPKNHSHTWDYSFKWKPPEFNTIDFLVEVSKGKNGPSRNGITSKVVAGTIQQYKTLFLKVGFSEGQKGHGYVNPQQSILDGRIKQGKYMKNRYRAEYFYPTSPYDPEAHICHMSLKPDESGEMKMFTEEHEVLQDDMIVEFKYDKDNEDKYSRWVPLRIRHDKTNEYKKYRNKFGNAYHVANSNWHSIHNPVTKEMIITGIQPDITDKNIYDDGVYYERSGGESKTKNLRNFHNKVVKKMLFKLTIKSKTSSVLDFAVGKNGDLPKWIDMSVHSVLGIDISEDNIHNRFDGACARYLNMYNSKKRYLSECLSRVILQNS